MLPANYSFSVLYLIARPYYRPYYVTSKPVRLYVCHTRALKEVPTCRTKTKTRMRLYLRQIEATPKPNRISVLVSCSVAVTRKHKKKQVKQKFMWTFSRAGATSVPIFSLKIKVKIIGRHLRATDYPQSGSGPDCKIGLTLVLIYCYVMPETHTQKPGSPLLVLVLIAWWTVAEENEF